VEWRILVDNACDRYHTHQSNSQCKRLLSPASEHQRMQVLSKAKDKLHLDHSELVLMEATARLLWMVTFVSADIPEEVLSGRGYRRKEKKMPSTPCKENSTYSPAGASQRSM
jgi:hypothetical protein